MPELPEVETVRRGLAPVMEGRRIVSVTLNRGDLRFPFPDDFAARIDGRRVLSLGRRAKYLLLALEGGETLIAHLGMSGTFRIEGEEGRRAGRFSFPARRRTWRTTMSSSSLSRGALFITIRAVSAS